MATHTKKSSTSFEINFNNFSENSECRMFCIYCRWNKHETFHWIQFLLGHYHARAQNSHHNLLSIVHTHTHTRKWVVITHTGIRTIYLIQPKTKTNLLSVCILGLTLLPTYLNCSRISCYTVAVVKGWTIAIMCCNIANFNQNTSFVRYVF